MHAKAICSIYKYIPGELQRDIAATAFRFAAPMPWISLSGAVGLMMGTHGWQPAGPCYCISYGLKLHGGLEDGENTVLMARPVRSNLWDNSEMDTPWMKKLWGCLEMGFSAYGNIPAKSKYICRAWVPLSGWWAGAGKNWATKGPLQRWVYPICLYFYFHLRNKFLVLEFGFLNIWKWISIITGIYSMDQCSENIVFSTCVNQNRSLRC